jgi:hypothetical protein
MSGGIQGGFLKKAELSLGLKGGAGSPASVTYTYNPTYLGD